MPTEKIAPAAIPKQTLRRLPVYYNLLKEMKAQGVASVSAPAIARQTGLGEVQVRKDLAAVSVKGGRPRTGFPLRELLRDMEQCLGYNNIGDAVLLGAGHLGRALLSYEGFREYGVQIIAAFDADPSLAGQAIAGKQVFPLAQLATVCQRLRVRIGILTVPAAAAQDCCDQLVACGVTAIWNFAPVRLLAPEHIMIQNENMAASLALLSQHLATREG